MSQLYSVYRCITLKVPNMFSREYVTSDGKLARILVGATLRDLLLWKRVLDQNAAKDLSIFSRRKSRERCCDIMRVRERLSNTREGKHDSKKGSCNVMCCSDIKVKRHFLLLSGKKWNVHERTSAWRALIRDCCIQSVLFFSHSSRERSVLQHLTTPTTQTHYLKKDHI